VVPFGTVNGSVVLQFAVNAHVFPFFVKEHVASIDAADADGAMLIVDTSATTAAAKTVKVRRVIEPRFGQFLV
jgi:hypothetical protein